jgi:hypothetical protein
LGARAVTVSEAGLLVMEPEEFVMATVKMAPLSLKVVAGVV